MSRTGKQMRTTVETGLATILGSGGPMKSGATLIGTTGRHGPKALRKKKKMKGHPGNFKNLF